MPALDKLFIFIAASLLTATSVEASRSCSALFASPKAQVDIEIPLGRLLVDRADPISRKYHEESESAFNVIHAGTADPRASFIRIQNESLRFLEQRPKDGIPTALLGPGISVAVFRNPGERLKHPSTLVEDNGYTTAQGEMTGKQVQEQFSQMLAELYSSYAKQGAKVKSDIETYRQEDLDNSNRSTHFVLAVEGRPLAHVQALHATGTELLNIERHFPSFRVSRDNGSIIEIGRLRVLNAEGEPFLSEYYGSEVGKRAVGLLLYQKLMTWLNWDLKQPTIVMHVNESVRRVLMHPSSPLVFDTAEPVVGPTGIREWALQASRVSMLKSEQNLMRILLLARAKRLRSTSQPHGDRNHFVLSFSRNELNVLARLGLLSTQKNAPNAVFFLNSTDLAEAERGFFAHINITALDKLIRTLEGPQE